MKLELQKAKVKNIAWGDKTALLADGTLQINKEEFIAAAADSEHFKTLDADLARPGESVRVCPVKDVIEPRYKTEGPGQVFPGMLSDVETVGSGKTFVLEAPPSSPAAASSDSRKASSTCRAPEPTTRRSRRR